MKVLIVDDNPNDRDVLRYTVERYGHEAITACDGQEGLQAAEACRPDLIISDALMPVTDGFQFLRNIKRDANLCSIPFIFYSAVYGGHQDMQLAASLGAAAYIIKPKEPVEFWEEVEKTIGGGNSRQGNTAALVEEDAEYLRRYSQVVSTKLEEKVRELEKSLAERKKSEEALRESEQRYREIFARLMDARESERRHIAHELHDEIGQSLTGMKLMLDKIRRGTDEATAAGLRSVQDELNSLMVRVRDLSLKLHPSLLDSLGLLPALQWHFKRYTEQTGIQVDFVQDCERRRFPMELEMAVYRVVQEALTNVARYAGVGTVKVTLSLTGQSIVAITEDEGAGFHPEEVMQNSRTMGLTGMHERVNDLGGTLTVRSRPGSGTRLTVALPLACRLPVPENRWNAGCASVDGEAGHSRVDERRRRRHEDRPC